MAAAAAGFDRFCLCGLRAFRFDIRTGLGVGLAPAASALFLQCGVLGLGRGTVVHLDLLLFGFVPKTRPEEKHYKDWRSAKPPGMTGNQIP
tara:strand:- start:264 stop:536 length:273 start_codon:yes stop_codon:yes gene_type:complete